MWKPKIWIYKSRKSWIKYTLENVQNTVENRRTQYQNEIYRPSREIHKTRYENSADARTRTS